MQNYLEHTIWGDFLKFHQQQRESFQQSQIQLNELFIKESQLLQLKMAQMNAFIFAPIEESDKFQTKNYETTTVQDSGKNEYRKKCIERYKAKKHTFTLRTVYNIRKEVADRRLRLKGKFLTLEEEEKVLIMKKILGRNLLTTKNHNIRIKNDDQNKLKTKDSVMRHLTLIDPKHIKKRIQKQMKLFKIL